MYARDALETARYGLTDADSLARVGTFVLLTIRQPLSIVPQAMVDVQDKGEYSSFLFGAKRAGWRHLNEHAPAMLGTLRRIIARHGHGSPAAARAATALFYRVPGLGAVKAGFYAQLLGFDVGCIDSHNLTLYSIDPRSVTVAKTLSRRTQRQRLASYVDATLAHGAAQGLWDRWCEHVAGTYHGALATELGTADDVSAFHVRAICGDLAPPSPDLPADPQPQPQPQPQPRDSRGRFLPRVAA